MRIKIVVAFYDEIQPACSAGIEQLLRSKKNSYDFFSCQGAELAQARNLLIDELKGFNKVLTVDDDIEFTEADVDHLIQMGEPFCALPYQIKGKELYEAGLFHDGKSFGNVKERFSTDTKEIKSLTNGYVGAGFNMYDTAIISKMKYPWYYHPIVKSDKNRHGFELLGEDMGFCMRLQEMKIPVVIDFGRPVKHIIRDNEVPGNRNRKVTLKPLEVGLVLKGLNKLPREVSDPLYNNICRQVGKQ